MVLHHTAVVLDVLAPHTCWLHHIAVVLDVPMILPMLFGWVLTETSAQAAQAIVRGPQRRERLLLGTVVVVLGTVVLGIDLGIVGLDIVQVDIGVARVEIGIARVGLDVGDVVHLDGSLWADWHLYVLPRSGNETQTCMIHSVPSYDRW